MSRSHRPSRKKTASGDDPTTSGDPLARLSDRQKEVLRLLAKGLSCTQMATHLNVTVRSLAFHHYRLMEELDIHDRVSLVRFAMATRSRQELLLEIDIPADADEREVEEVIARVIRNANALHKAHGGSGLKIEDLQIWQDALVAAGAD